MTTRNKPFRCLALALFLSIGAGLIWSLFFGISFSVIDSMNPTHDDVYEMLEFTLEGVPVIQTTQRSIPMRTYRDLNGKAVEVPPVSILDRPTLFGPVNQEVPFSPPNWSSRIQRIYKNDAFERLFFVCDDQLQSHGYLEIYDTKSRLKMGYIGRNGFRTEKPPLKEQFPIDGQSVYQRGISSLIVSDRNTNTIYLLTKEGLTQIDPKTREIKRMWKDDIIDVKMAAGPQIDPRASMVGPDFFEALLIRVPDQILAFDENGKKIRSFPLPLELRDKSLTLVSLEEGQTLFVIDSGARKELFWIDATGKITNRKEVNLRSRLRPRPSKTATTLIISCWVPSIGMMSGAFVLDSWDTTREKSLGYEAALNKEFQEWWPTLLTTGILGMLLAVVCYRRQRKYGLVWTPVWVGFVFLFGVPGFLGYLAHRRWPARLECPSCGKLAPRDRESCFSCHQNFPEPSPKGTEVFT